MFRFSTAWAFSAPAFRVLGILYPALSFDIASLDIEMCAAEVGMVRGTSMSMKQASDYEAVYLRVEGKRNEDCVMVAIE